MAHDHGRPGRAPLPHDHSGHDHAPDQHGPDQHGPDQPADDGDWDDDDVELDDDELAADDLWVDEDWDEVGEDDEGEDEVSLKEAFGLPDVLPPIRLPSPDELGQAARAVPMLTELAALADWVGTRGRVVDADAELSDADRAEALAALGVAADRFPFLWKYAGAVDWIEESAPGRVTRGETAEDWADGEEGALTAWAATFSAVLTEAMCVAAAGPGRPDVDFHAPGGPLALLFFMGRREGLTFEEVSGLVEEILTEDEPARVQRAWAAYVKAQGDPAAVLLGQLTELGAVTPPAPEDGAIRLTPLALWEMREQFADAGVDVPLLPASPAEMTAQELVALAGGVSEEDFDAEAAAWIAARDPGQAASELLDVAADGDPADRLLAVAVVTEIGADAESAWRDHLGVLAVRPYAKASLAQLGGLQDTEQVPPDLLPDLIDASWLATDMISVVCDDEDTEGDEIADAFASAIPPDATAAAFLDLLSRGPHPDAIDVVEHIAEYHPDKAIAKEAKKVLYKVSQRNAAASRPRQR